MASRSGSPIFDLLVIFLVVYALQFLTALAGLVSTLFVLSPPVTANPWTIVTSVYAHAGFTHLVSNALALVIFGWPIARATTRIRFHLFFVCAGSIAGVSQIILSASMASAPVVDATSTAGVLGASGAVFALLGYLLASNRLSASVAGVVGIPSWLKALLYLAIAIGLTVVTASPGAALIAHFTGLLVGLFAGKISLLAVPR